MQNMISLLVLFFASTPPYFPFLSIYRSHDFRLCGVHTSPLLPPPPSIQFNERNDRKKNTKCKHCCSRSHPFDLLLHVQAANGKLHTIRYKTNERYSMAYLANLMEYKHLLCIGKQGKMHMVCASAI